MKKQNKKVKLGICICLLFAFTKIEAQFTAAGTYSQNNAGIYFASRQPGNDIMEFNGDIYRISSWSNGTTGGIAWEVTYSATSYNSNNVFSYADDELSDVCLVNDGTDAYAIATYYCAGTNVKYYWEVFIWDTNLLILKSTGAWSYATGPFGTSLHIDADEQGNFVIIWDDQTPDVNVVTGTIAGLNNSNNPVIITGANGGINPDACIFNNNNDNYIHATWIDKTTGNIIEQDHSLAHLSSGSTSHLTYLNAAPTSGHVLSFPRIACPNSSGSRRDWTLVMMSIYGVKSYIEGYNDYGGTISSLITYNGTGTNNPVDLSGYSNVFPVVTYDDNYNTDGIWVGWTYDNNSGFATSLAYANYPLIIQCNRNAIPLTMGTYWQVPNNSGLSTGDYIDYLSLAGRHASNTLYLTYAAFIVGGSTIDDLLTKEATSINSATGLRIPIDNALLQSAALTDWLSYYINSDIPVSLKLFDTNGKMVLEKRGTVSGVRRDLEATKQSLVQSIYLAHIIADDGSINVSHKIFIGE